SHAKGVLLVTLALAIKATAGVLLPFLILIWATRLTGSLGRRVGTAIVAGLAIVLPVFAACTVLAGVDLGWLPALSTSALVVEWLSLPTAAGQIGYLVGNLFASPDLNSVLTMTRMAGWVVLAVVVARQWWLARDGDAATVLRRAAMALLAVA